MINIYNHFKIITINGELKDNSNLFFKLWRNKMLKNLIINNLQQFKNTKYKRPIEFDYQYESLDDRYFYSSIIIKYDPLFNYQFVNRLLELPEPVTTLHIKFDIGISVPNLSNYIPMTITTLKLESNHSIPIPINFIPPTIKVLYLSKYFNQLTSTVFPINSQLETIDFGDYFNQKIQPNILPKSLTKIRFSKKFNQRLEVGSIPSSVRYLIFGNDYNKLLRSDAIPTGCNVYKTIEPNSHSQPPQTIQLNKRYDYKIYVPNYIKVLYIGPKCSSDVLDKLDNINQESNINTITLNSSGYIDYSIISSINTLKTLEFGNDFSQPVGRDCFPTSLEHLIFGESFYQTITNDILPYRLKTLVLQSNEIDIQYPITAKVYVTRNNDIIRQKCETNRKLFKKTKFF